MHCATLHVKFIIPCMKLNPNIQQHMSSFSFLSQTQTYSTYLDIIIYALQKRKKY